MDIYSFGFSAGALMTAGFSSDVGAGMWLSAELRPVEVFSIALELRGLFPARTLAANPIEVSQFIRPTEFDRSEVSARLVPCLHYSYFMGCASASLGFIIDKSIYADTAAPSAGIGPRLGFQYPFAERFAVGAFGEALVMPIQTTVRIHPGNVHHTCPVCQCTPSETTCHIPTEWHASAAPCPGDGAPQTTFDAPAAWTGDCTPKHGIATGALCDGAFCAQSVTVAAPTVTAAPCTPQPIGQPAFAAARWTLRARECLPLAPGTCPRELPDCTLPGHLHTCLYRDGDHDCPPGHPTRHLLYRDTDDARACAPCACGPAAGNACVVFATAYKTSACTTVAGAINVTSDTGPGCFDVPPGLGLGGKTADIVATTPGTCPPTGGHATGTLAPAHPLTLCCQSDTVPE